MIRTIDQEINISKIKQDIDKLKISLRKKKPPGTKYKKIYTTPTYEYITMRKTKEDVITWCDFGYVDNDIRAFKFDYMWNPYTGKRHKKKDPYGPLYFNPCNLVEYFYHNRLRNLWKEKETLDDGNSYFEGFYDSAVGLGPEFNLISRGKHLDWYLFRLPVPDCYILSDQYSQSVTMGPYLTANEIKEIGDKSDQNRKIKGKKPLVQLLDMYSFWHLAVNNNPFNGNSEFDIFEEQEKVTLSNAINRVAVDYLKNIKINN